MKCSKKELERALELAINELVDCPLVNTKDECPLCLTHGPKARVNSCGELIAEHFLALAKEKK